MASVNTMGFSFYPKNAAEIGASVIEVFWCDEYDGADGAGWYYGNGTPGCLFDNVSGPYATKKQAWEEARDMFDGLIPSWRTMKNNGYC